jgi:hypothetical protein
LPQPRPLVSLDVDPCTGLDDAVVRHLVELELGTPLAKRSSPDLTRLAARCDADGVFLVVDDPVTAKSLSRRIDLLHEPASTGARLLALAGVELVAASWNELAEPPSGQIDVASAVARRSAIVYIERRREPPEPTTTLAIEGTVRSHDAHHLSWGAGLAVRIRLGRTFAIAADVLIEHVSADSSVATADVTRLTCAPRLGASLLLEGLELEAAVGFRLGAMFIGVSPFSPSVPKPDDQSGLLGGPILAISGFTGRNVTAGFGLEAGYAGASTSPALGTSTIVNLDGPWLLLTFSLGLSI